jgi:hypothetical protein
MTGAPPFRLPGIHFVGAILWLGLGGAGLMAVAPDLAAARFLEPRVLAVTHLYTLGVLVMSVFGALYQFYPMSLGAGPGASESGGLLLFVPAEIEEMIERIVAGAQSSDQSASPSG